MASYYLHYIYSYSPPRGSGGLEDGLFTFKAYSNIELGTKITIYAGGRGGGIFPGTCWYNTDVAFWLWPWYMDALKIHSENKPMISHLSNTSTSRPDFSSPVPSKQRPDLHINRITINAPEDGVSVIADQNADRWVAMVPATSKLEEELATEVWTAVG